MSRLLRHLIPAVPGVLALAALAQGATAQEPARYRALPDTVWSEAWNPHWMYWVVAGDTVGDFNPARSVEREVWGTARDGRLTVEVQLATLGVNRHLSLDTFTVAGDGRVELVNGRPPGPHARIDLRPHLPAAPLTLGRAWTDTLHTESEGPVTTRVYRVERTYRVARSLDTLGARVVEVVAEGTVRYRDGWWADSAAGTSSWLDVTGPVRETFWLDVARGQMLARRWEMDLRGIGGLPRDGGGTDTVSAGLRSGQTRSPLPAARGVALTRELPHGDTTITVAGQRAVLLHVAAGDAAERRSAVVRDDGRFGTARLRLDATGHPVDFESVWTDSAGAATTLHASVRDGALRVRRGPRDTTLALPDGVWAIADHGMDDLLIPALLSMPRDGQSHPLTVHRPYTGRWDQGFVVVRDAGEVIVAAVQLGTAQQPDVLLLSSDGDLLMRETAGAQPSQRVPRPGSAARATLEALLARLQGAGR